MAVSVRSDAMGSGGTPTISRFPALPGGADFEQDASVAPDAPGESGAARPTDRTG